MTRLRLKQLAQDGATTGQSLAWDGTKWAPGGGSAQWWDDVLTSVGGETIITLGQTPLARSERVWLRSSGVELLLDRGVDYTITANTITLLLGLTSGQQIRTYYAYASGLTGAAATLTGTTTNAAAPYSVGAYSAAPYGI